MDTSGGSGGAFRREMSESARRAPRRPDDDGFSKKKRKRRDSPFQGGVTRLALAREFQPFRPRRLKGCGSGFLQCCRCEVSDKVMSCDIAAEKNEADTLLQQRWMTEPFSLLGLNPFTRKLGRFRFSPKNKKEKLELLLFDFGRGGIRTPGWLPNSCFQDRRIRPLCHSSILKLL
ncbi:MAG: hypothetical protein S4CHLAM2_06230 [Chlamydiales bacterium]|nr:hypothetical protein [Chlamydiales bacterium]